MSRSSNNRKISIAGGRRVRALVGGAIFAAAIAATPSASAITASPGGGCSKSYIASYSWNYIGANGTAKVFNCNSTTKRYKINISGGWDTDCYSIAPFSYRTYSYFSYPWGPNYAVPNYLMAC